MKTLLCLALAILAIGTSFAQDASSSLTKDSRKFRVTADTRPVTQAEALACLRQVQSALSSVLNVSTSTPGPKLHESKALVSREQTLLELNRLFVACKPKFVIKPARSKYDATRFVLHDKNAKAAANNLVAWGCVPPVAPVVTGPGESMTPAEFGDALGYFVIRIADLTHTPSTRFSPLLKGLGPG